MRHCLDRLAALFANASHGALVMSGELLSSQEAARRLGISVTSLYDWLARSRRGEFRLRGQPFTINYLQGGSQGQGRIRMEESEVERIKEAMRVHPLPKLPRRLPRTTSHFPGITVPLGRPDSAD